MCVTLCHSQDFFCTVISNFVFFFIQLISWSQDPHLSPVPPLQIPFPIAFSSLKKGTLPLGTILSQDIWSQQYWAYPFSLRPKQADQVGERGFSDKELRPRQLQLYMLGDNLHADQVVHLPQMYRGLGSSSMLPDCMFCYPLIVLHQVILGDPVGLLLVSLTPSVRFAQFVPHSSTLMFSYGSLHLPSFPAGWRIRLEFKT